MHTRRSTQLGSSVTGFKLSRRIIEWVRSMREYENSAWLSVWSLDGKIRIMAGELGGMRSLDMGYLGTGCWLIRKCPVYLAYGDFFVQAIVDERYCSEMATKLTV
ncbi:hypothetical protein KI387_025411 [Taxus chinensis]|uniref:Uncharacterized protein n=1 Tax=Taxus chinensis TaxID=29808 RepID=A0AA38FTN0_TAXCH|nr:hypothetical protein KI387_025411 [Taxus chinensis]